MKEESRKKVFKIAMSERCFRFKPDALASHAPPKPGVYEFVTFHPDGAPEVLYVGTALGPENVQDALAAHMDGRAEPTAGKLFAAAKDVYFDYVSDADIESMEDLKDIAGALVAKHKPKFNADPAPSSGRYGSVAIEEIG
ncbi:MAG: GIY-YIG nuclease family protein [Elusimicrobiota bacterium]